MADRVLPSRELAAVIAAPYKGKPGEIEHFYKIITAYASGRLVDREAIDYEAANVELAKQVAADRVYDAFAILDAALPDEEV